MFKRPMHEWFESFYITEVREYADPTCPWFYDEEFEEREAANFYMEQERLMQPGTEFRLTRCDVHKRTYLVS